MIRARLLCADRVTDLRLAFARLGIPADHWGPLEMSAQRQILLTDVSAEQKQFLASEAGLGLHLIWGMREGTALLSGTQEQFEELMRIGEGGLNSLARAVAFALRATSLPPPLLLGGRRLIFGQRTFIMGVVNVTPDSFSDGGRFLNPDAAVTHALFLAAAGADLLDIGGESSRPGAQPVSADEELSRILPVIQKLRNQTDVPISVDTSKSEVAREALAAGASLINDISGFRFDPKLPEVVQRANAACCLMHLSGTPQTMQKAPTYQDLMDEVLGYLEGCIQLAERAGIPKDRVLVDPGIGFGKTVGHNLHLLRRLPELRSLGCAVVLGTSRKSFLGALTGKSAQDRLFATIGSVAAAAVTGGADVVRVHDVAEAKDAVAVADAISAAGEAGALYETCLGSPPPRGRV